MKSVNRRQAFAAAGAALLAVALPVAQAPPLRAVYRYSYATDSWARVRMYELRAGDVFQLDEVGTFIAHAAPFKKDGMWSIDACQEIDPATNQWVPCGKG
jgi:hypothetical protein